MRQVRYSVAASLDGYIADANGAFDWIPDDPSVDFAAIFARVDTVLLGRRSFELVQRGDAPPWDAKMRVYVFSRTLRSEAYPGVTVIGANAAGTVAALRSEPGTGDIWLFGGGELFGSLLAAGQVDAVEVTVVPVLLGGGVPLVTGRIARTSLRLLHTHRYPTGMVTLAYAVEPPAV
ncbi:MAG TPA: dihydrofolate reductase family protein [Gemmatimonadales bacterium]|nr:dihydrofolate reductase family protein [Gemmatimonadales bacterium]